MTRSPQEHVDAIKSLCDRLQADPLIADAQVNDWGYYSNFDIHIVPAVHTRHSTVKIRALVRKQLKGTGAHLRAIWPPDPLYRYCPTFKRQELVGYSRDFWALDIDFLDYDLETDSFS